MGFRIWYYDHMRYKGIECERGITEFGFLMAIAMNGNKRTKEKKRKEKEVGGWLLVIIISQLWR
jgi:hypothetical protein